MREAMRTGPSEDYTETERAALMTIAGRMWVMVPLLGMMEGWIDV